jgi:predicted esterase
MTSRVTTLIAVGLHCIAATAQAQDAGPRSAGERHPQLEAHRTGTFSAALAVRSPESEARRWAERFGFPSDLGRWDYDLADESFSLYVPDGYVPDGEPYGVVVWVSPSDDGSIPSTLRRVLDARRLIWIGANDAGNARHLFVRAGLALDAAHNVALSYQVDPDRIYVAGLSGGGRVAAMEAVAYPDVFDGGFPIIGVTTYLDIPLESDPSRAVLRFPSPSPEVLERARRQPLVILTGSGDYNGEECRLTAAAYERDGYTDLHLIDVDGMGHQMPSADDFARGLDLLLSEPERQQHVAGPPTIVAGGDEEDSVDHHRRRSVDRASARRDVIERPVLGVRVERPQDRAIDRGVRPQPAVERPREHHAVDHGDRCRLRGRAAPTALAAEQRVGRLRVPHPLAGHEAHGM